MPSSHATHVHAELRKRIASELSRYELAMLRLTSSRILAAVRVVLYRRVVLHKRHLATVQLLLSDKSLANSVLDFQVFILPDWNAAKSGSELVEPFCAAAQALPSVQKLYFALDFFPMFEDPVKQQKFIDHFNNRKIPLREFGYRNRRDTSPLPDSNKFSLSDELPMEGPRITDDMYTDRNNVPQDVPYIWDILQASRLTLEEIRISFWWDSPEILFWQMHFPRLRLLALGDLDMEKDEDNGVGNFLVANPSIQELSFDVSDITDFGPEHYLLEHPTGPLGTESLPNLQVFSGLLIVFPQLARHQPRCFQTTLHTVNLSVARTDTNDTILAMLDELLEIRLAMPLLPALRHFDCDLMNGSKVKTRYYPSLVRRFARLIGDSLESWRVQEPQFFDLQMKTQVLAASLAKFKHLRTIHMEANYRNTSYASDAEDSDDSEAEEGDEEDEDSASESGNPGIRGGYLTTKTIQTCVHTLAIHCPSLELVKLEDFSQKAEFKIERRGRFDDFRVHVPREFAPEGAWVEPARVYSGPPIDTGPNSFAAFISRIMFHKKVIKELSK